MGGEGRQETLGSALRGTVASMSMSGMRMLGTRIGLIGETPPEMIADETTRGVVNRLPPAQRDAVIILLHWTYGAGGGVIFGSLPTRVRQTPWAGPVYGILLWLLFELVLAPALGLHERRRRPLRERAALAVDHLLYGAILSELRRRPGH